MLPGVHITVTFPCQCCGKPIANPTTPLNMVGTLVMCDECIQTNTGIKTEKLTFVGKYIGTEPCECNKRECRECTPSFL